MSGPSSRTRRLLVAAAGIVISAVSVFLLVRSVDVAAAWEVLLQASLPPLIAAMGILLLSLLLRVVMWQALLPPDRDGGRVSARRVAPVLFVGYLANLVLPARLGEVVRAYLIDRRDGIPFGGAMGSIALERVLDITTLALAAFLAAIAVDAEAWVIRGTGILAAIGVIGVAILTITGLQPILALFRRLGGIRVLHAPVEALSSRLERFVHWSGGAHRRRVVALVLVMSAVAWACNAAVFWLIGVAVGADITPAAATLIMATTVLATAIPSAPAYVGTFELAAVTVAVSLGVPPETALAYAVLAHVLGILPAAVGGAIALASMGGGLRAVSEAATEEQSHLAT